MSEDEEPSRPSSSASDLGGGGGAAKSRICSTGGGGDHCFVPSYSDQVLENVLENVLCFLSDRRDRNNASLVCKSWFKAEAMTRSEVFIGNCYAVSPKRVTRRFARVTSMSVKGKPRFADFGLLPRDWGARFSPWVAAMAEAYRALEKLYLKRIDVSNEDLIMLARSFPNFKELVLVCCEEFGTSGLATVACECRKLRVLDLIDCDVKDDEVDWISCFPETKTCLESLIFDCVDCDVNFQALEQLVMRSPSLKKLRLNGHVSIVQLYRLMVRAPQLTNLGTGSFGASEEEAELELDYTSAFAACKSLVCLSGFREILADYLPAIYPVCTNLTSLNFSYASISAEQLKPVICHCHKLQILWVLDSVCDEGLKAVAATCKDLRELRVFPADAREDAEGPVSEVGLLAISEGCRKLQSILYFCQKMTNAAVIAMSKNCPDLEVFRLCIMGRHRPDHLTGEPMDEGFGAIVKNCKKLTRLSTSGLLTDQAFSYIGKYGKLVRTLSVGFAGDSDLGLKYVLEGCPKLQKLEIRDCPFGDSALHSGIHHYYNMRFVWLSACKVTHQCCKEIAHQLPRLVVEVIDGNEMGRDANVCDTVYMYRSLDGPRCDAPKFVQIF
nr:transport inhibitor response 1-like protein [Ipomoea batatas]